MRPGAADRDRHPRGGSALFYADLMDVLGTGRVLTIDIVGPTTSTISGSVPARQLDRRRRSSSGCAGGRCGRGPGDGDPGRQSCPRPRGAGAGALAPLVTPGSFLLSQDGIIDKLWIFRDTRPGPLGANRDFLAAIPNSSTTGSETSASASPTIPSAGCDAGRLSLKCRSDDRKEEDRPSRAGRFVIDRPGTSTRRLPGTDIAHYVRTLPRRLGALAEELGCRLRAAGCSTTAAPTCRTATSSPPTSTTSAADLPGQPEATLELAGRHRPRRGRELRRGALDPGARARRRTRRSTSPSASGCCGPAGGCCSPPTGSWSTTPTRTTTGAGPAPACGARSRRPASRWMRFEGMIGLAATGLQLLQDAIYWRLPRAAPSAVRARHPGADRARRPAPGAGEAATSTRRCSRSWPPSRERAARRLRRRGRVRARTAPRCCTRCSTHRGGLDVHVHYLHGPGCRRRPRRGWREMVERPGRRDRRSSRVPDERLAGPADRGVHAQGDVVPDLPARAAAGRSTACSTSTWT